MPDCLLPLTAARLDNVNGLWGSGVDPVYFTTMPQMQWTALGAGIVTMSTAGHRPRQWVSGG